MEEKRYMNYSLATYHTKDGKEYNYISYLYHEVNDRGDEKETLLQIWNILL